MILAGTGVRPGLMLRGSMAMLTFIRIGPVGDLAKAKSDLESTESWFSFLIRRPTEAAGRGVANAATLTYLET